VNGAFIRAQVLTLQHGVITTAHHSENIPSWSDEQCPSSCTLSFIRLYLDNRGRKCNQSASCVFVKELALLWCGRQFL